MQKDKTLEVESKPRKKRRRNSKLNNLESSQWWESGIGNFRWGARIGRLRESKVWVFEFGNFNVAKSWVAWVGAPNSYEAKPWRTRSPVFWSATIGLTWFYLFAHPFCFLENFASPFLRGLFRDTVLQYGITGNELPTCDVKRSNLGRIEHWTMMVLDKKHNYIIS